MTLVRNNSNTKQKLFILIKTGNKKVIYSRWIILRNIINTQLENMSFLSIQKWDISIMNFSFQELAFQGNYLLVIYKNNNEDDIILSERFMVYEDKSGIDFKIVPSNVVSKRRTHQELEFEILLNRINVINTGTDIYPVIRQNKNWLYAVNAPDPLRVLDGNKRLIYKFYNGELNFPGNNEFRFIDLTMVNFKGNNVCKH